MRNMGCKTRSFNPQYQSLISKTYPCLGNGVRIIELACIVHSFFVN
jgi:hypothetical protein